MVLAVQIPKITNIIDDPSIVVLHIKRKVLSRPIQICQPNVSDIKKLTQIQHFLESIAELLSQGKNQTCHKMKKNELNLVPNKKIQEV